MLIVPSASVSKCCKGFPFLAAQADDPGGLYLFIMLRCQFSYSSFGFGMQAYLQVRQQ